MELGEILEIAGSFRWGVKECFVGRFCLRKNNPSLSIVKVLKDDERLTVDKNPQHKNNPPAGGIIDRSGR